MQCDKCFPEPEKKPGLFLDEGLFGAKTVSANYPSRQEREGAQAGGGGRAEAPRARGGLPGAVVGARPGGQGTLRHGMEQGVKLDPLCFSFDYDPQMGT